MIVICAGRQGVLGGRGCRRAHSGQSRGDADEVPRLVRALVATKKITIAAVHGLCLGGGAELAMVCDMVYTSEEAEWGFPEIKLGCYPPVACTASGRAGGAEARGRVILTGRSISRQGSGGNRTGDACCSGDAAQFRGRRGVGQLLHLSPAALAVAKKASYAWDSMHFDKGPGACREDLFRRSDEDGRRAGRYPGVSGEASAEVDAGISVIAEMDYEITAEEVKAKLDAARPVHAARCARAVGVRGGADGSAPS